MTSPLASATPSSPAASLPELDAKPVVSPFAGMIRLVNKLAAVLTMIAIVAIWELSCDLFKLPEFLLPAPSSILKALTTMAPKEWFGHAGATIRVALTGYAVSICVSLPLAVALALSPILSRTIYPILVVIHSTPIVAVAPIIVVVLGVDDLPRIVITFLISFFPLVISTATGVLSTPEEILELSRSLRGTRGREIIQIRLPYAVPYIFSALKVSITLAVIGAVVAEFVAAEKGLGYSILFSTSTFKIPQAFAALGLLVVISLVLFNLVVLSQKLLFPWSLPRSKQN
jgi:NitT/TauT family transport system permease protein